MNIVHSVISAIANIDAKPAGHHPLVCRFMKAVFLERPSLPRHYTTWNPDVVLSYIRSMGPNEGLSLIQLSWKLVMFMLLVSGQRGHTLHLLDTMNMTAFHSEVSFRISDLLKTSRPGVHPSALAFLAYTPEKRLCLCTIMSLLGQDCRDEGFYYPLFLNNYSSRAASVTGYYKTLD